MGRWVLLLLTFFKILFYLSNVFNAGFLLTVEYFYGVVFAKLTKNYIKYCFDSDDEKQLFFFFVSYSEKYMEKFNVTRKRKWNSFEMRFQGREDVWFENLCGSCSLSILWPTCMNSLNIWNRMRGCKLDSFLLLFYFIFFFWQPEKDQIGKFVYFFSNLIFTFQLGYVRLEQIAQNEVFVAV